MKTVAQQAAEKAQRDREAGTEAALKAWEAVRTQGFGIIVNPGREKSLAYREAFVTKLQTLKKGQT